MADGKPGLFSGDLLPPIPFTVSKELLFASPVLGYFRIHRGLTNLLPDNVFALEMTEFAIKGSLVLELNSISQFCRQGASSSLYRIILLLSIESSFFAQEYFCVRQ